MKNLAVLRKSRWSLKQSGRSQEIPAQREKFRQNSTFLWHASETSRWGQF